MKIKIVSLMNYHQGILGLICLMLAYKNLQGLGLGGGGGGD